MVRVDYVTVKVRCNVLLGGAGESVGGDEEMDTKKCTEGTSVAAQTSTVECTMRFACFGFLHDLWDELEHIA